MRSYQWFLAIVVAGLFSCGVCFGQDAPKTDTDAVLQDQPTTIIAQKPKPEPFSFRGITFGTGVDEISGLVPCGNPPLLPDLPNCGPLVWYVRKNEKPINDVEVAVRFGFYKGKLIKIVITGPTVAGFSEGAHQRIDEALNIKYGKPQLGKDICKKNVANLWGSSVLNVQDSERLHRLKYGFQAMTVGAWIEAFPVTPLPRTSPILTHCWWLFNERVLMASIFRGHKLYCGVASRRIGFTSLEKRNLRKGRDRSGKMTCRGSTIAEQDREQARRHLPDA